MSIGELFKNPMFMAAVAAPVVGALASKGEQAWDRMRESRARTQGFREMLDMHPELREHRDQVLVGRVYNSLARVNPHLAADPFVAGASVSNVIGVGDHIHPAEGRKMLLNELDRTLQHRSQMSGQRGAPSALQQGITGAFTTAGAVTAATMKEKREESGAQARLDAYKEDQKNLKARELYDQSANRAYQASQNFTRLTGVALGDLDHSKSPSGLGVRARRALKTQAEETLGSGLGIRRGPGRI